MYNLYHFVSGPLVWAAFAIFIVGCLAKVIRMLHLVYTKERFIFSFMSLKYSLRSIIHWSIPFGSVNMRRHPVMTVATFAFHICLMVTPIFLLSHLILVDESWGLRWMALPDSVADIMTIIVIATCLFFLFRRLKSPEVQYVTSMSDYWILAIVAAPFITGFYAYHQGPGYTISLILHILSGEIMLVAIPFTRLSHMIFSVFSRAYTGSELGGVRHARDW
jgi:nitrate reductase gamma subunit